MADPRRHIRNALADIEARSGIDFDIRNVHSAGSPVEYVQVKIQYDAVLGQRNTTKLDLDFDERLVFPTQEQTHDVEDIPSFELAAYSVEEILVEKLRSLFQRARARDYYDLYRLLNQESFDDQAIVDALIRKSQAQGVTLRLEDGLPQEDLDDVQAYWDQGLDRLVTNKPPFGDVVDVIDAYLDTLAALR